MAWLKSIATSAAVMLGACTPTGKHAVTRLGADPVLAGGTYSTGGGITVASELRDINGKTGVCGVWSDSASQVALTRNSARNVLGSGSVYLGDKKLVTGLSFLKRTRPTTQYSGLAAGCIASARPWQPGDRGRIPIVRLPRQVVHVNLGDGASGQIIEFRQTGPGALGGSLNLAETLFKGMVRLPLGQSPARAGGRYSTGGGLSLAAELRQIGTEAYVCGVWTQSRGTSRLTEQQAPEILARGTLSAGGQQITRDLRFFRRAAANRPLAGRSANCLATGTPWAKINTQAPPVITLERQVIHRGLDRTITFVPSGLGR